MKQILKGGDEFDCTSKARKRGYLKPRAGTWKAIKRKMNRRYRKEGKQECQSIDEE